MSNKRIIYPQDNGTVAIIVPSDWYLATGATLEDIAAKDVPPGKPWKIIDVSDIPEDRTLRNAWEADFDV